MNHFLCQCPTTGTAKRTYLSFLLFGLLLSGVAQGYPSKVSTKDLEVVLIPDKMLYSDSDTVHIEASIKNLSSKTQTLMPCTHKIKKDRFNLTVYVKEVRKLRIRQAHEEVIDSLTIEPGEAIYLDYEFPASRIAVHGDHLDSSLAGEGDTARLDFEIRGPWIRGVPLPGADLTLLLRHTQAFAPHCEIPLAKDFLISDVVESCQRGSYHHAAFGDSSSLVIWDCLHVSHYQGGIYVDSGDIYGQLVSDKGEVIGDSFRIGRGFCPRVAWDSKRYLVVSEVHERVYGQFISDSGLLMGNEFAISDSQAEPGRMAIASNGTNYLVSWKDGRNSTRLDPSDIYGQVVSRDGRLVGANFAICRAPKAQDDVAIASDGKGYLVVWEDCRESINGDIFGQLVSGNGTLIDTDFPIAETEHREGYPAVVWSPCNYLVVFRGRASDTRGVCGQLVSNFGELTGQSFSIGESESPFCIFAARGDTTCLVTWEDWSYGRACYGRFILADGTLLSPPALISGGRSHRPVVVGAGSNFLIVCEDGWDSNSSIYGIVVVPPGEGNE